MTQAEWVKELKRVSSGWVKEHGHDVADFAWQSGYGAFSVSASNLDRVAAYVRNQVSHHSKASFQEEMRDLLLRHRIEWDERYVWD